MMKLTSLPFFVFFCLNPQVWAANISLDLPIRCEINEECFIQNYVDQDSSNGWKDYRCNNLSYNKHKGTDFTIRSQHLHSNPIAVIAAADGKVLGTRNNKEDINPKRASAAYQNQSIKGAECGNGLVIQHRNNWQTQYCHMKKGSVSVQSGQNVKKGDLLGYVGHSGMAEFPHLHLSVRHKDMPIDPFTGTQMESGCNARTQSLWSDKAKKQLTYPTSAIIDYGIKSNLPADAVSARMGEYRNEYFSQNTREALMWVEILRPTKGDVINITLISADGKKKDFTSIIKKTQARYFQYVGTKSLPIPPAKMKNKHYTITYELIRDRKILDSKKFRTSFRFSH